MVLDHAAVRRVMLKEGQGIVVCRAITYGASALFVRNLEFRDLRRNVRVTLYE